MAKNKGRNRTPGVGKLITAGDGTHSGNLAAMVAKSNEEAAINNKESEAKVDVSAELQAALEAQKAMAEEIKALREALEAERNARKEMERQLGEIAVMLTSLTETKGSTDSKEAEVVPADDETAEMDSVEADNVEEADEPKKGLDALDEMFDNGEVVADEDDGERKTPWYRRFGNYVREHKKRTIACVAALALAIGVGVGVHGCSNDSDEEAKPAATVSQSVEPTPTATATPKVEEKSAEQMEAERLGVSKEDLTSIKSFADKMSWDNDTTVKYMQKYNVPASVLGTTAAESYMRDSLNGEFNVNESLDFSDQDTASKTLAFAAANNPAVAAEIIGAIQMNGGSQDSLLDGLQLPAVVDQLTQTYRNDQAAYDQAVKTINQMLSTAQITFGEATGMMAYSYYEDGGRVYVSRGPIDTYGVNKMNAYITFADGTRIAVKEACAQLFAAPISIPTTPYNPERPNVPENPGTPPTTPPTTPPPTHGKDPHANDPQQNAANANPETPRFEDNAPATNNRQTVNGTPRSGESIQKSGNTDGNASNGSEEVPDADKNGNISGTQPEKPEFQNW